MSDFPPFSPEDQALLDALRDEPGPTSADRDRVRAAVFATVGTTVMATGGAAKAATATSAAAKTGIIGLPLKVGMAVALVAASGATGWWWSQRPAEGPLATVAAPSVVAEPRGPSAPDPSEVEVAAPVESVTETVREDVAEEGTAEPAEPSVVAPIATASAAPATADDLAAEVALMREVQAAMASGNHRQALLRLEEHARRFPRGALSAERNGARAITYCRMGRGRATGRALAARLLAANPSSLMAARLREACGLATDKTKETP